ncbi:MAG: hypothetical protein HYT49_03135 [Candidatus Wildermuthbacteria bacterium]|nr:hypothetical protein [Candidatus Wildermuthbacteria bacterium]
MQEKTIIGFGLVPYPRIVPALFLQNYVVYAVKDTADLDVLRPHAKIFCLEEKFPKAAAKIHAASYLLGNYAFHAFLKSRRQPFHLLMHRTTEPIIQKLEEHKLDWLGNRPESFQGVWLKTDFYKVLHAAQLPYIETVRLGREEIAGKTFSEFNVKWQQPMVAYRVFPQTGMEQSPFILLDEDDWEDMRQTLSLDEKYSEIQISPIVRGISLSMVGCVTHLGVLTSPLQLQFHNVPEVLHGEDPSRLSFGQDFGFCSWDDHIEKKAQEITEKVGEFLSTKGFHGIFGVDFLYNTEQQKIFATECMPQFTEDLHIYSLMTMAHNNVPPLEFFHIMATLGLKEKFDFAKANAQLKKRFPASHIFLLQKGIETMPIPLRAGVYSFSPENRGLTYLREGAFPWDLKNESEFLMLDSMPRYQQKVIDNVPSLFKLIFPRSIAESSSKVKPDVGELIAMLSQALREEEGLTETQ